MLLSYGILLHCSSWRDIFSYLFAGKLCILTCLNAYEARMVFLYAWLLDVLHRLLILFAKYLKIFAKDYAKMQK